MQTEHQRILWAKKAGFPEWQEFILSEISDNFPRAIEWGMLHGFHSFRVQTLDMSEKPDFIKTIKTK